METLKLRPILRFGGTNTVRDRIVKPMFGSSGVTVRGHMYFNGCF